MERLEILNQRLIDYYGVDTVSGHPIWRIVFSDDQYEKRLRTHTDEGFELNEPVIDLMPKYKQWIDGKYILERLEIINEINELLGTNKTSYECKWVYEDKDHNPLPPKWEITEFVITTFNAALGKSNFAKYTDESIKPEAREQRIFNLEREMFGNETEIGDALAHKQAIVVPRNYEKES